MIQIELSPSPAEDTIQHCEMCEDDTLHISVFTRFTGTGQTGYLVECEPCMLAWDWR